MLIFLFNLFLKSQTNLKFIIIRAVANLTTKRFSIWNARENEFVTSTNWNHLLISDIKNYCNYIYNYKMYVKILLVNLLFLNFIFMIIISINLSINIYMLAVNNIIMKYNFLLKRQFANNLWLKSVFSRLLFIITFLYLVP